MKLQIPKIESSDYHNVLSLKIKRALNSGITDVEEVCRFAEGAFPLTVIDFLKQFGVRANVSQFKKVKSYRDEVEEHPIDYDWRFDDDTACRIARLATEIGGAIACLGTPTVCKKIAPNQRMLLIDNNPLASEGVDDCYHVCDQINNENNFKIGKYKVIVMDPPWYGDHYSNWLRVALDLCEPNSYILTTMFRSLTRIGAGEERERLVELLTSIGEVSWLQECAVYKTPSFEQETLAYHNVHGLLYWRVGDLVLVKVRNNAFLPKNVAVRDWVKWKRFVFGNRVIVIRDIDDGEEKISVKSIYDDGGFVLRSVSRTDLRRDLIGVWSSKNHCYQVSGYTRLSKVLKRLQDNIGLNQIKSELDLSNSEVEAANKVKQMI